MGIMNLDRIFSPKSVALVGATERPGGIGDALMKNLLEGRERRAIFPVNPNHKNIHGLKSFASLSDIGEPVELVLIAVPDCGRPRGRTRMCASRSLRMRDLLRGRQGNRRTGQAY